MLNFVIDYVKSDSRSKRLVVLLLMMLSIHAQNLFFFFRFDVGGRSLLGGLNNGGLMNSSNVMMNETILSQVSNQ